MSGKSLYPLSISLAAKLAKEFDGRLRISYSGGADYYNIERIVDAGIWPVTVATTLLKPGGYQRLTQMAKLLDKENAPFGKSGRRICRKTCRRGGERPASCEGNEAFAVKKDAKKKFRSWIVSWRRVKRDARSIRISQRICSLWEKKSMRKQWK